MTTGTDEQSVTPPQRVVCAAIKQKGTGLIVTGARHFDIVMVNTINAIRGTDGLGGVVVFADAEQGFIDQFGNFLSRQEAYTIAEAQGQLRNNGHCKNFLFSEDLY